MSHPVYRVERTQAKMTVMIIQKKIQITEKENTFTIFMYQKYFRNRIESALSSNSVTVKYIHLSTLWDVDVHSIQHI